MSVRNNGTKLNIPMCMACVLLCAVLFSIHLTSGLYSRYVATGDGTDSARVITFGEITLEETGDFVSDASVNNFLITPGVDLKKQAKVSFEGSESATYVFVEADLSNNWVGVDTDEDGIAAVDSFRILSTDENTTYMEWQIENEWEYLGNDGGYVYYRELEPNTTLNGVDIIANEGKITVSSEIPTIVRTDDITSLDNTFIKFRAIVVQAGGFADALEAWNSVRNK